MNPSRDLRSAHRPASVAVVLGRRAEGQCPENVPAEVGPALLAETLLDPADRPRHEADFVAHFGPEITPGACT